MDIQGDLFWNSSSLRDGPLSRTNICLTCVKVLKVVEKILNGFLWNFPVHKFGKA